MKLTLKDLPQEGIPSTIPINASGLKVSACQRRWMLTVYLGLRPHQEESSLLMGKVIHKYAEDVAYDRGADNQMQAMLAALKQAQEYKLGIKEQGLVKAAIAALNLNQLPVPVKIDAMQGAEYKFEFPIDNYPGFVYTGTIDLIGHDPRRNIIIITDYKTTRKYLFKDVVESYTGDSQFTFYPWIVRRRAYDIFKSDINLANLAWYNKLVVRPLIVMLSAQPPTWRVGPEWSFTDEQFEQFGVEVEHFIEAVREYIADEQLPPPTGMVTNSCPSCPFKRLCFAQNKDQVDLFLGETPVVKYEPLKW